MHRATSRIVARAVTVVLLIAGDKSQISGYLLSELMSRHRSDWGSDGK
jgi:hypothetical protein